ncbi:helix-turn-helix domain-containing protein [Streptomyces sp. ODS28]|uniref:AraC family transcriptional regulator n=1 Tax=Streptomyces sp. ODS28 TaxID=3136688 RepID=UPI0031F16E5A
MCSQAERPAAYGHAAPGFVLEVVPPPRPARLNGVSMAGFRDRGPGTLDMRAVPHPSVTLALDFGPGALHVEDAAGRRGATVAAGLAFAGLRVSGRDLLAVQVRLSPLVARAVLGAGPAELAGSVVALEDIWGREAALLRERLSHVPTWAGRFAMTEELLVRRYEAGRVRHVVPAEVAWAWGRIARSRGGVRVEALATETGWSRQRLWSRFRAHIGLTPQRAAHLVRFHHAAHRLAAGRSPGSVAAESGYFDQSHLHRHVRSFTGVTPAALAREPFLAVDDDAWPGHAPPVSGRR